MSCSRSLGAALAFYTEKLGFEVRGDARFRRHPEPMRTPGAPLMFMLRDPDHNTVVVVEEPPTS